MATGATGVFSWEARTSGNTIWTFKIYYTQTYTQGEQKSTLSIRCSFTPPFAYGGTMWVDGKIQLAGQDVILCSTPKSDTSFTPSAGEHFIDRMTASITVEQPAGAAKSVVVGLFKNSYAKFRLNNFDYSYSNAAWDDATATINLQALPLNSSISSSNGKLGSAMQITADRVYSNYSYSMTYQCGSATGTITSKISDTVWSWTPPMELARQNTTGGSIPVTFTLQASSGGTVVSSATASATLYIPESVRPGVSIAATDESWILASYGAYAQGKSTVKMVATSNVASLYGASIVKCTVIYDGETFTDSTTTTDAKSYTFRKQAGNTGSQTIRATVTDSRGRTATAEATIQVAAYRAPTVTAFALQRTDGSGGENANGEYAKITWAIQTGYIGSTALGATTTISNASGFSVTRTSASGTELAHIGSGSSTFTISTVDALSTTASAVQTLRGVSATVSFRKDGVSFGEVAERAGFNCAWDSYFMGNLACANITDMALGTNIRPAPYVDFHELGFTDSNAPTDGYFREWLKHICRNYPDAYMTTFAGRLHPNSTGFGFCFIYSCATVNSDGLPQYSAGAWYPLGGGTIYFGTLNYESYCKQTIVYTARGLIANSAFGGWDGYGAATIMLLPNGIARIDYGYKMVGTPNTGADKFRWGLNRDLLSNLAGCPTITPTNAAGTIMIYKPDGTIWQDRIDYCGTNQHIDQFWVPARIYSNEGADGAWQEEVLAGARIMGTAYGTY